MNNNIKFKYEPPKVQSGYLKTPVVFFEYSPNDGPEQGESVKEELHSCFAEVYNPSMKDTEKLKTVNTKQAITINIRDTKGEYVPTNKDFVEIKDYRYKDITWNIVEVRPDFEKNAFITLLLGVLI